VTSMLFIIGFSISFTIICGVVYFFPLFKTKKSLFIVISLTTLSFILSYYMTTFYNTFIGIGIFILLISSLALLIGKKRSWMELNLSEKSSSSRRTKIFERMVTEVNILENLSSADDRLLYKITPSKDDELYDMTSPSSSLEELAAEIIEDAYAMPQVEKQSVPILSDKTTNPLETEKQVVITDKLSALETEELSDQWMQERLHALFDVEPLVQVEESSSHEELDNSLRYDDLSESYFSQFRSEKDGTKE